MPQNLIFPLPPIPKMQSLCSLFHHKNLLNLPKSKFLSPPLSLASNPPQRCSCRPLQSGNRGCEEESRVSSDPGENPRVWTTYDPFTDQFEIPEKDPRSFRIENNLDGDSSEGDEKPQVSTFYDPLEGKLIAKVEGEERKQKKPEKVKGSSGSNSQAWSAAIGKRRTGKVKVSWVCDNCGGTTGQWWGTCPSCHRMGSVKQFSESEVSSWRGAGMTEAAVRSWLPQRVGELVPQSLKEVNKGRNQSKWRIPLSGHFGMEVARVLGGGLVPGSLVLVGGDPGIGKSTLLLQLAAVIAQGHNCSGPAPVIYVSGEESIEQIGNRADRMRISTEDLFLYSSTDIEDILDKIQALSPQALIVDSIQTVYLRGVTGSAGNIMQVKECTSAFLRFAKQTNIPVLLIGHVTKTGDIAGPRILEHIVDAVLYMEGERYSSFRLLRSVKNRFGSTDELGVFEMSESGLEAVSNPSEMFLSEHYSDSEILAGLAVAVVVDGSRTFVIEIQALCVSGSSVARHVDGVREGRADMIIAVLMKQAGLKLQDSAIFLNVVSGFKLTETAGDLAIAAAICSSFLEFPIPNDVAFIGEIGLGGELRAVPRLDKRVIAVAKLGYKRCVIPKSAEKLLTALNLDITILGCRTLKEVINTIFREG